MTIEESKNGATVTLYLMEDFKNAYKNSYVLKWSLWWSSCLCGYFFASIFAIFLCIQIFW